MAVIKRSTQDFEKVAHTTMEVLGKAGREWGGLTAWGCYLVKSWNCGCSVHYNLVLENGYIELALCPQHENIIQNALE